MTLLLIIKLLVVVFFLIMFLRRPTLVWGVGLLTVTTAVLLDTFLSTFGQDEVQAEFGFFYYVITGMLFGGAAIWLWGVLRPLLASPTSESTSAAPAPANIEITPSQLEQPVNLDETATDQKMLYEEIRLRFSPDDVLDLMFDLGINENDVASFHQDMDQLIIKIMNTAQEREQTSDLALTVERILTPPPPENLPRLEKINLDSPPTILRQYLLAQYDQAQLEQMSTALDIDWEQIGINNKRTKVRELLLYLSRRNRTDELIDLMQMPEEPPDPDA